MNNAHDTAASSAPKERRVVMTWDEVRESAKARQAEDHRLLSLDIQAMVRNIFPS